MAANGTIGPALKGLRVGVTGSSGLIGRPLVESLRASMARVTRFVRRPATGGDEIRWDPNTGVLEPGSANGAAAEPLDAVVHLAGENIGAGRWTAAKKDAIRNSRVGPTRKLCETLAGQSARPRVLVVSSGIGVYGDTKDVLVDESAHAGASFLAQVVCDWEAATQPAVEAGIRVVNLRTGIVLSREGGALQRMLLPFRLGLGGPVGAGNQYWSWISRTDIVRAIELALALDTLVGPVNAVAPAPATSAEFAKVLGGVLGRPAFFPLPAFVAKTMLGEMAQELLLTSTRVHPTKLLSAGFRFRHETLEAALRDALRS